MSFLQTYRNRLVNLNHSNRALCLLRSNSGQDLDLSELDFLQHASAFEYLRALLEGKKTQVLLPVIDARSEKNNLLSSQLKKIQRRDKWLQEESGSQDLYLGWPFVEGKLLDGSLVRCPLLLFPVALSEQNGNWLLQSRGDQTWVFNKTFQLAYAHFNKIPLNLLPEPEAEDFPEDAVEFRTKLFEFLRDNQYTLHFNRELFENKLRNFVSSSASDLNRNLETGQLKLQPHALLGFFPYAGSWLVSDYEALEQQGKNRMEDFFPKINSTSPALKEEHLLTPLPMDGAQEDALRKIRSGQSLVVQGPPGTGKSQLIVNLIADYCARGKKVLLVSQKRAALEVVWQRLKKLELSPFAALIHDLRAERPELYRQISEQIENSVRYEEQNNKLDTVFLEREFISASRSLDLHLEKLKEFKAALYDASRFGISAKELYLNTTQKPVSEEWVSVCAEFNHAKASSFASRLEFLLPRVRAFWQADYPFRNRKNIEKLSPQDTTAILEAFQTLPTLKQAISDTGIAISPENFRRAWELRKLLKDFLDNLDDIQWSFIQHAFQYKRATTGEFEKVAEKMRTLVAQRIPQLSSEEVALLDDELPRAIKLRSSLLGGVSWNIKASAFIKKILSRLQLTKDDLGKLSLIHRYWNDRQHVLTKLSAEKWMPELDPFASQEEFEVWNTEVAAILSAKEVLLQLEFLWKDFSWKKCGSRQFSERLGAILPGLELFSEVRNKLLYWFSEEQLYEWIFSDNTSPLSELWKRDVELLKETDGFIRDLQAEEQKVLRLLSLDDTLKAGDFLTLIQNAWLQELEKKYPCLTQATTGTLDYYEQEVQKALAQKETLSLAIVQLRLKEFTYRYSEYNRLQNRTTYRELLHQCTKRKKIWPVRKLMQEYHEELFRLVPCWMASPETVSALFPAESYFDLVIFDEASQCFTEKGLPSIHRGKQCVIAGDSKQLRPSDLYRVRWEEEGEESLEEETESLLELAAHYLPQVLLRYHYRSSKRELIEFSNRHFYQNKLDLIPEYGNQQQALFYHKVSGEWAKQQNRPEAEKVVALIWQFASEKRGSIGVVTFNYPQAELIQELLEEKIRRENWNPPADLFVKNLENVQGDERDCILFSVGYAPDAQGRLQLRFGSLNQEDGIHRLNVAVTRARKEVHVVASLLPSQMETERVESQGPKLLKSYLQFVWDAQQKQVEFSVRVSEQSPGWYLRAKVKDQHWQEPEVPLADLQQQNTLLLTDDDQLYSRSEKEFFGLIPRALAQKGWEVKKMYSRGYFLRGSGISYKKQSTD